MSLPAFNFIRKVRISSLNISIEEYQLLVNGLSSMIHGGDAVAFLDIDRLGSPAGDIISIFFNNLHKRTAEQRRAFRSQVLQVTIADLQRVAKT
jgi:Zn-dependent M16 (insulinase) family peptidase